MIRHCRAFHNRLFDLAAIRPSFFHHRPRWHRQLDQLVSPIALYPDPLLAQNLTASTFSNQIPDAATWGMDHRGLIGDPLAQAIQADNLPWDPSVLALLLFPNVRHDGARSRLDGAARRRRAESASRCDGRRAAKQRQARDFGYLTTNTYDDVVDNGGYLEIQPLDPACYYYVPIYNPLVVFYAPRPGFFIGGAIRFGPPTLIGPAFGRFGWFAAGFVWSSHAILIDHRPWARTWVKRGAYVHTCARPYVRPAAPHVQQHAAPRAEKNASANGPLESSNRQSHVGCFATLYG